MFDTPEEVQRLLNAYLNALDALCFVHFQCCPQGLSANQFTTVLNEAKTVLEGRYLVEQHGDHRATITFIQPERKGTHVT